MLLLPIAVLALAQVCLAQEQLLFEWVSLDYTFRDTGPYSRAAFQASGGYDVTRNIVTGVKLFEGETYVTVPRWFAGVPSTLNRVSATLDSTGVGYLLEPFPSWELNDPQNPGGLRYVQSMEIDEQGRMWIIDVGRLNIFEEDPELVVNGPARLVLWDVRTNSQLHEFVFPHAVAPFDSNFLNDLAVDVTRGFAYISDSMGPANHGGLIVYDLTRNQARRFEHESMRIDPEAVVTINGVLYPGIQVPCDGIAVTPDGETVFFAALTAFGLFSIRTEFLRDFSLSNDALGTHVIFHGNRESQMDGMAFDNLGRLYFGLLSHNGVAVWQPGTALQPTVDVVQRNSDTMQWVDTFAFDNPNQALVFTTNRLQLFFAGTMLFDGSGGSNMRVFSVPLRAESYLFNMAPAAPVPVVCPGESAARLRPTAIILTVLVVSLIVGPAAFMLGKRRAAAAKRSNTYALLTNA